MKGLQVLHFRRYAGVTLLTGLISTAALAQVSHPAKLSQRALEGAAFDDPSTTITEVGGENILDFTSLTSSDGKFASGMYKAGPQTFDITEPYGVDEFMFFPRRQCDAHLRRWICHNGQCRRGSDHSQRVDRALGDRGLSQDLGDLF